MLDGVQRQADGKQAPHVRPKRRLTRLPVVHRDAERRAQCATLAASVLATAKAAADVYGRYGEFHAPRSPSRTIAAINPSSHRRASASGTSVRQPASGMPADVLVPGVGRTSATVQTPA